jgi:hypothetical protein
MTLASRNVWVADVDVSVLDCFRRSMRARGASNAEDRMSHEVLGLFVRYAQEMLAKRRDAFVGAQASWTRYRNYQLEENLCLEARRKDWIILASPQSNDQKLM